MAAEMYFDDRRCSELMFSGSTTVSDRLYVVWLFALALPPVDHPLFAAYWKVS